MATVNDKLINAVSMWSGTLGSGGIADASTDTFALASTSGLDNGGVYVFTIDRVDGSGNKTLAKREVVIGEVSGDNVINVLRGQEGTAQAHSAGAVVEVLFTAKQWSRLMEGLRVAHNDDGAHKSGSVFTLPQINDTTADHQYIVAVNELIADRTVTLPLLTGNDEFVFKDHAQTLTNKTNVARVATYTPAGAGTTTLDLSTGNIHTVTMPAATQTLAISNATAGQCFMVEINNVTSQGALTWFSTIRWSGGSAPSLTGTNGKRDVFGFRVTGAGTYDGFVIGRNL